MSDHTMTLEAVFENGVLRPINPLPLKPQQRVTVIVQVPAEAVCWPADVAAIYQEIRDEDRRLANAMWANLQTTWPVSENQPWSQHEHPRR